MSKRIFDGTGALPINSTAARVVAKGEHFDTKKKITQRLSVVPMPTRPFPRSGHENLTALKVGRFTVLGLHAQEKHLWVVRCVCGNYETRNARAIKNKKNDKDCCQICRQKLFLRKRDRYNQGLKDE